MFVGSVFSPYYAEARRTRGPAALPQQHCAVNLAMYRRRGGRWVLSEAPGVVADAGQRIRVGNSEAMWQDGQLILNICEKSAPWGAPVRGSIRLRPQGLSFAPIALHPTRPHRWWPVAPCAWVEVRMEAPQEHWEGRGYHDANWGQEPLSRGFAAWTWQRLWHADGTLVQYLTQPRGAEPRHWSALYRFDGTVQAMPPLAPRRLPDTRWGLRRHVAGRAREIERMEDTPFYSRSRIAVMSGGETLHGWHEQLDMDRFDARWVQFLLRFRMRQRG